MQFFFFLPQQCNMMLSVFIDRVMCLVRFEALRSFHQCCIQTASKESKSKNKCIIEFTLHTWMKYLFFWFLMKNAGLLQRSVCVRVCARVCMCVRSTLPMAVWWMHDKTLLGVPVDSVAWLQDPLQTLRSITLLCTAPLIQLHWSPPQQIDSRRAQPSHQHRFHSVEISHLMPSGEFTWFDLGSDKKTHIRMCHLCFVQHKHVICHD